MPSMKSFALGFALLASAALAALPAGAADNTLKDIMKKMGGASASGDAKSMAPLLGQAKGMGKPEYPNWGSFADQGKAAA